MLINVQMPTVVGIFTHINMINTSVSMKAKKKFNSLAAISCSVELSMKKFITLWPDF